MPEWRKQTQDERLQLAAMLREARQATGMSQDAVAKHFGIQQSIVSDIENAERDIRVPELLALAKLYDVDPCWFLVGGPRGPFSQQP